MLGQPPFRKKFQQAMTMQKNDILLMFLAIRKRKVWQSPFSQIVIQ